MALVEPIPGEPAAIADVDGGRALVVADYHAGLEAALRYERGVELDSDADSRREHVLSLLAGTGADRVVFLGDLAHALGAAQGEERDELVALLDEVTEHAPVTVVKGNHDGEIESIAGDGVTVTDTEGARFGRVGFAHGHTWPGREVFAADVLCIGHEHPTVRLEDAVGGRRVERAWLRGPLVVDPFEAHYGEGVVSSDTELVVFPAFNDRTGGTWVNVAGQGFLAPFLPAALPSGQAYLLDGTRLGEYREV